VENFLCFQNALFTLANRGAVFFYSAGVVTYDHRIDSRGQYFKQVFVSTKKIIGESLGGVVYVNVTSPTATEEIEDIGREIESRQGIGW
jgi:hypothetical protein